MGNLHDLATVPIGEPIRPAFDLMVEYFCRGLIDAPPDEYTAAMEDLHTGLRMFFRQAWPFLEPVTLEEEWYLDAIADHLSAVTRGEILDLIITMPPRSLKSTIAIVCWPAWEWGPAKLPHLRWLFNTYRHDFTLRDSKRRRMLMATRWYQQHWGHVFRIGGQYTSDTIAKYENNKHGIHLATSVSGGNTGEGGERIIVDDPHNMKEIHSEAMRGGVLRWWDEVMSSRRNDLRTSARVIIMQRGHEDDLVGHIIGQAKDHGYTHLNLPMEYDPQTRCMTPYYSDPRSIKGQVLSPTRFPPEVVSKLKMQAGSFAFNAQYNQAPTAPEGGILKRSDFRYWVPEHRTDLLAQDRSLIPLPTRVQRIIWSWDMAFKGHDENSKVCGQAWARNGANAYLLSQRRSNWGFSDTKRQVVEASHELLPTRSGYSATHYVEDKANGPAILDELRDQVPGLLPFSPHDSKEARVYAMSPRVEAHNYYLPHPVLYPWVEEYLKELCQFPNSRFNDQVDCTSQADRVLFGDEVVTAQTLFASERH